MPRYAAVTGFAGFLGRHVTEQLLARGDYVYGVDCFTYAADPAFARRMEDEYPDRFHYVAQDIRGLGRWPDVDAVLHLAAETHVDNSLTEAGSFVRTNVEGTQALLDMTVAKRQHGMPHFLFVSTDEVYGPRADGHATVTDPLAPSSPYAASKASADLLVQAWGRTYGLPYTILRPTNCYGSYQYPEKLIPKTVRNLVLGRKVPIHGDGSAVRSWLAVEDCARAILHTLDHARDLPPILNIGGNRHASVREVVAAIVSHYRQTDVTPSEDDLSDCAEFGLVRAGMDERYAVDDHPLRRSGWSPTGDLFRDLPGIVDREHGRFRW